jgi:hypothetical protein
VDTEPPPALSGLTAEVDAQQRGITLKWNRPEIPDLQGYFVYRSGAAPATGGDDQAGRGEAMRLNADPLPDTAEPAFLDTGYKQRGLAPGGAFRYGVSAVDNSYNEGPIVFIEATVPDNEAPKAPPAISARSTESGSVRLKWQPGLEKDLATHRIYRKEERSFELVAEVERSRTEWIDSDVRAGVAYSYHVTEVDESGNESEPSLEARVVPSDIVAPDPPEFLEVVTERRGLRLTWRVSPSPDATGYLIYRAAYPGAPWQRLTRSPVVELAFVDRQGGPGNLYGVTAVDSSGNESNQATIRAQAEESAQ